jgi:hypothetical protein
MHTPAVAAPLSQLVTAQTAITAARPTIAGDGVDINTWILAGKFRPTKATLHLQPDGADRTISNPTGGTAGIIELWGYKPDRTGGAKKWYLMGTIPTYSGATLPLITASGGYATMIEIPPGVERVHVAGTPSGGAPTFYVEPLEQFV